MPGSVASGAATLVLARIVPPLASFGVFYLAVLHWGPDGWGLFHLLLSVHAVLQMVAGLGVDLMVLEKGSSKPQELPVLLHAASGLLFRGGLFLGAAMVAVAWSLSADSEARVAAVWFAAALPASSLSPTLEATWISLGRTRRVGDVALCEHGLRVLGSFIALSMGGGPAALALVLFGSKWIGTASLLLPLRKIEGPPEPIAFATLVRQASPFACSLSSTLFSDASTACRWRCSDRSKTSATMGPRSAWLSCPPSPPKRSEWLSTPTWRGHGRRRKGFNDSSG